MTENDKADNGRNSTLDDELAAARNAVGEYGPASIDMLLEKIAELAAAGVTASVDKIIELMQACKHARGFEQMVVVAEIFDEIDDPKLTLLRCQARIDSGEYDAAAIKLERLLRQVRSTENKEIIDGTLGLLGRAHKQKFVREINADNPAVAEKSLRQSFNYYNEGYDFDFDPAWHGANLAALAWRAEQEGIRLDAAARDVGARLLRDLGSKPNPDPWTVAAVAQGYMAQSDWDSGYSRYEEYFRRLRTIKGRSAAFSLYGDIRQLSEIWLADSGEVPEAAEIIEMLRERMARTALPGVSSHDTSQMLTAIGMMGVDPEEELQAMVASGEIIPVEEMCRVIENRHVVAKITDPDGSPKGTGFLLDAKPLGVTDAHAVFVTNNHVVATDPTSEAQIPPDVARVDFQSWENGSVATFTIKEVKAETPRCEHDITVCTLEGLPADANVAKVKSPEEHFLRPRGSPAPLGRVHPIGHPDGGPLSLSLAGNEVVDHDLFKGPRGVRRLHYKANTKRGSSGSPVFGKSGQVVAVHRAMAKQPIAGTSVQHIPTYAANEGIGIGCIISWFQGR